MMIKDRQNDEQSAFCLVVIVNRSILAPNFSHCCRSVRSCGSCHSGIAMNRLLLCLFVLATVDGLCAQVTAQETEAATRQYAVAVGFQNQKLFDDAIDEWKTFLRKWRAGLGIYNGLATSDTRMQDIQNRCRWNQQRRMK